MIIFYDHCGPALVAGRMLFRYYYSNIVYFRSCQRISVSIGINAKCR